MKKFQSGGKFKIDYFQSSLNGQLQGNPEDKIKQSGNNDVELADRLTQWSTPGTKEKYEENFGTEAYDKFNEDYNSLQKEYNQFQSLKLNRSKKDFVDEHLNIAGNKWNTQAFISTIDKDLEGKRILLSDDSTEKEKDIRQAVLDNGYWRDDQGELYKFTAEQKSAFDSGHVEDNELFKSKDGRKIKGFVYEDPEKLKELYGDENGFIRGKGYLKALYYGDEQGNDEVVSGWDFTGVTKIQQQGNIYSALPRAVMGFFGGIIAGVGSLSESAADLMNLDSDNAFRQWAEARNLRGQAMGVSKSSESKENILSDENLSSLLADVSLQLVSGRAFATAGGKIASLAGGSINSIKKTSQLSSIVPLTVIATADARNQAKAAGFSDDEAALFQGAMLLGMFGVNKAFSWVDETTDLVKEGKQLNKLISDKIVYTADLVKNATTEVEKSAIKEKGLKGLSNTVKDFITSGTQKIGSTAKNVYNSKTAGNIVKESLEETSETWTEYGLKGMWNIYSETTGQKKDKHFLSSEDPNYWKQLWIETGMSAVGGALGAGMAQGSIKAGEMFFNKTRTEDNKNRLVDIILSGEGDKYLNAVDEMHSKELLGKNGLSTIEDIKNGSYLSIEEAGVNAVSQNDANYRLILNEFNSINSLINGIGSKDIKKLLDENPNYQDGDIAGEAISNVRKLTSEYLKIKTSNPSLTDAQILVPENIDKNDEKYKTYIKELATNYKVTEEEISRLIDIKQEITDINSGKFTQKFLLKKLLKDSVFNGKNEEFKKYGDNFLDNLLEAIDTDNKYQKEQIKLKKDNMKENALLIEAIKPDLSNIKELKEVIDSGKVKELSISSKNKLKTIVKDFDLDPVKFNSLKYIINKTTKDIYNRRSKELVSSIIEQNPSLDIEKVNSFVNSFYETILENKLSKVNTSADFDNLALPNMEENIHVDDILEAIDDLEDTHSVVEGSISEVINNNDPKLLGKTLGDIVAESNEFNSYISHFNPIHQLAAVKFEYEKAYQPVIDAIELIKSVENITDERHLNENPFDFSFLKKEFSGSEKGISIGADLSDRISGLKSEYDNSIVNGVSYFDNIEETKSLLNQLIVKRDLLNGLLKYSETLTKYNSTLDRIVFNPKNKKSVELFKEGISSQERLKFSRVFKDIFYDPLMLGYLRYNQTLTPELADMYSYLDNVQDGLTTSRVSIKNDIKLLSNLLKTAEANQNTDNIISLKKKAINDQIKFSVESLYDFITLNGLDLTDDSSIKEFIDYYFKTYGNGKRTEDALLEDQKYVYKIYDYLRSQDNDNKIKWLDNYYKNGSNGSFIYGSLSSGVDDTQLKTRNKLGDFNRIAIASFIDIREFNEAYRNILGNDINSIPSAEQEEVALAVVAHMNSDIANKLQPVINSSEGNSKINDTLVVLGTAGAGKSTFALGYGVLIGQQLQNNKSNKKYKILLGSNNQDQIKTITETCNNFKFGNSKIEVKTIPGKNGGTGVQVNDLIALLELVTKGDKFLDDVSTIAYDEATMISYFIRGDRESELGKILNLIEKINLNRDKKGEEKLKLILLGDSQQNGVIIGDESANIGVSSNNAFRTKYLNFNYRAKVSAITEVANTIKHLGAVKPLTDITSTYGYIQNQGTPKLGGVRFVNQEFDAFNNDELIENIKNLINTNKNKLKPELFKVAIVVNKDLPESKLKSLMDDINYKDNIKVFTHENVQGNEVDYVISVMDVDTFKNGRSEWQSDNVLNESIVSKKLATTIERARYFTLVVNETQRNFISEESKTISITESVLPEDAVKNVKDYRLKVLNNEEPVINEPVKQDPIEDTKLNTIDNTNTSKVEDKGQHTVEDKENKTQEQLSDNSNKEDVDQSKNTLIEIVKEENNLVSEPLNNLNKEAESTTSTNEQVEIKAAIAVKTADDQETGIVISEDEEQSFSKGIDEITTGNKLNQDDVAKMFHLQKGILTGYPDWRNLPYDVIQEMNKTKSLFINANLASRQDYESMQLKAINELRNNGSNFIYKLISRKGKNGYTDLIITAESEGKGVILARVFLPYHDNVKSPFNTRLRDLLDKEFDKKLTKAELNNILSHITNGGLKSVKNKITLSELRKKLVNTPGLKLSKHIFVTTKADSDNRGDSFIFYTFNDKIDLESDEMIKKFMSEAPKLIEFQFDNNGKPFNIGMFANGIGVLRLDTKPIKFSDFFKQSINLSVNGDYSLVNMVLQNKASLQIAGLFASSRQILADKFNMGANPDYAVSLLQQEKEYQDSLNETSLIKVEALLSELVNKNDETSDKILKFIVSTTNNLGFRNQTSTKDIISWPNNKKGLIGYAEAEGDKKRLILFNTNKLLEFINSDFNESEKEYALNFFDRLLSSSNKFSNGLYIRPNAVKNDYNNKVFARLEDVNSIDLENVFETNISTIDLPSLRLNIEALNKFITKPVAEEAIKEIKTESKEYIDINAKLESLQGNKNIDLDFELTEIRELINNNLDKLSSKEKGLLETRFSLLESMINDNENTQSEEINLDENDKEILEQVERMVPFSFSVDYVNSVIQESENIINNYTINNLGKTDYNLVAKVNSIINKIKNQIVNVDVIKASIINNLNSTIKNIPNLPNEVVVKVGEDKYSFVNIDSNEILIAKNGFGINLSNEEVVNILKTGVLDTQLNELSDKLITYHFFKNIGDDNISSQIKSDIGKTYLEDNIVKESTFNKAFNDITNPTNTVKTILAKLNNLPELTTEQESLLKESIDVLRDIQEHKNEIITGTYSVKNPIELNRAKSLNTEYKYDKGTDLDLYSATLYNLDGTETKIGSHGMYAYKDITNKINEFYNKQLESYKDKSNTKERQEEYNKINEIFSNGKKGLYQSPKTPENKKYSDNSSKGWKLHLQFKKGEVANVAKFLLDNNLYFKAHNDVGTYFNSMQNDGATIYIGSSEDALKIANFIKNNLGDILEENSYTQTHNIVDKNESIYNGSGSDITFSKGMGLRFDVAKTKHGWVGEKVGDERITDKKYAEHGAGSWLGRANAGVPILNKYASEEAELERQLIGGTTKGLTLEEWQKLYTRALEIINESKQEVEKDFGKDFLGIDSIINVKYSALKTIIYKDKSNIKLGEFFTANDVEDIIKFNSATNESLDENIGEAGEKILNSTWGVVRNILSLPLSNKLEIDRVLNSDLDLNKMKRAVEQILLFIEDEDKKNRIMEETKSIEDQLIAKKAEAMENSKIISGIDTTIASEENFVPYFKGKDTSPISEPAMSVLLKFKENPDQKVKGFYIEFLNGAWATSPDQLGLTKHVAKLYNIIKSISNDEKTFKEVMEYITQKSKESSCQ